MDEINPTALLPALKITNAETGEHVDTLTQSLAIIEFLLAYKPSTTVSLLPSDILKKAHVMEIVLTIACDIHPVQNLRVLQSYPEADRPQRAKEVIAQGLRAVEAFIRKGLSTIDNAGEVHFCYGDKVSLADVVLVPQVYNARRYNLLIL